MFGRRLLVRFRDVCHQERALSMLRRALAAGRAHHAYLFDGPAGVGKELAARALTARLLCETPGRTDETPGLFGGAESAADAGPGAAEDECEPCGRCVSCRLLIADTHPDFHLIHRGLRKLHPDRAIRESKGLFIVVELIRHFLIQHTTTRPSVARARVFLMRDAERMNEGAQNALLKTLEEPPPDTYLILVTASASRLLPTIRSRCQLVPFDLLPAAFVQEQLVSQGALEPVAARTLARLSGGRLGAALHWHQIGLLAAADDVCETLSGLSGRDPEGFAKGLNEIANPLAAAAIECADEEDPPELEPEPAGKRKRPKAAPKTIPTDEARAALKLVLMLIGTSYRDALLLQNEAGRELLTFERPHAIVERLAKGLPADRLDDGIRAVAAAEQMLDRNVAPQSACERLAVALLGEAAPA